MRCERERPHARERERRKKSDVPKQMVFFAYINASDCARKEKLDLNMHI